MITNEDIKTYIDSIPPSPKVVKAVLSHIQNGELNKAATEAALDPALKSYLQSIVNKPIFGFKNDIKELSQIFGVLGLSQAEQIVYNYLILLLAPKEWKLFTLNNQDFINLQDALSLQWKKVLEHKGIEDKSLFCAISLLPASIIVCEALFKEKQDEVNLLRSVKEIDYSTILKRLSNMSLFELCRHIAMHWELPAVISDIVMASSGEIDVEDPQVKELSKWMHLLFFYQLSQPAYVQAGLNDFIDFNIDYVSDVYEEFQHLMMEGEV